MSPFTLYYVFYTCVNGFDKKNYERKKDFSILKDFLIFKDVIYVYAKHNSFMTVFVE